MNSLFLLLGANLGDSLQQLAGAREKITIQIGKIKKASQIYRSEAWGLEDQPAFLNQVLEVETEYTAMDCLDKALAIEAELGRVRLKKWGSRVIDIDLLYYNEDIIQSERLKIPHPYIQLRNFTLIPLVEISPQFIHPVLKMSNKNLLLKSQDPLTVKIYNNEDLSNHSTGDYSQQHDE